MEQDGTYWCSGLDKYTGLKPIRRLKINKIH